MGRRDDADERPAFARGKRGDREKRLARFRRREALPDPAGLAFLADQLPVGETLDDRVLLRLRMQGGGAAGACHATEESPQGKSSKNCIKYHNAIQDYITTGLLPESAVSEQA